VSRERYYLGIKDDPRLHVKLTGGWETLVGEQDTFVHILEYENYRGFDETSRLLKTTPEVCALLKNHSEFHSRFLHLSAR
jgi:hypothetical protein